MPHVNADLVGASRMQPAFNRGHGTPIDRTPRQNPEQSPSFAARGPVDDRHADALNRIAPNRRLYLASLLWLTMYQRKIAPAHAAIGELPRQRIHRALGTGDHQQPAGVLVEAMHDACSR